MRNEYGEFVPGAVVAAILPARVEPISIEDLNAPEGSRLTDRARVYVPTGIEIRPTGPIAGFFTWNDDVLLWNGDRFGWGRQDVIDTGDSNPLAAAFAMGEADTVEFASMVYEVVESQLWNRSHTRAVLLRET